MDSPQSQQVWDHPDDEARLRDPRFLRLAEAADEVAQALTGTGVYAGDSFGYARQRSLGHCRLCGKHQTMTFEHMPPKSSGNSKPRRLTSAYQILTAPSMGTFPLEGSELQQRGSGFYVLCELCNGTLHKLGYVKEYQVFVSETAHAMMRFIGDGSTGEVPEKIRLQLCDTRPGRIVRQALAMLLCASGSPHLADQFPSLRGCILEGSPIDLPLGMTLHLSIVAGPRGRFVPPISAIDFAAGTWQVLTEATFAPFSWVLRVSPWPPDMLATDVSEWTALPIDEIQNIDIVTQTGFVYGAVPLDYRDASEFPE